MSEVSDRIDGLLNARLSELIEHRELGAQIYELAFRTVSAAPRVDDRVWLLVWLDLAHAAPSAARAQGIEDDLTFDGLLSLLASRGVMLGVSDRTANLLLEVLERAPEPLRAEIQEVLADRGRLVADPAVTVVPLKNVQGG